MTAQTAPAPKTSSVSSDDSYPKAELFVGYQWLNPGGNIPTPGPNPIAFHLPSIAQGFGTNLSWNFTRYLALEGNYGGDWNSHASINAATIGPKLTFRGDGVDFFAHTLLGFERLSSRGIPSSNGIATVLGGGMDLKLTKRVSFRVFEADFQYARQNFSKIVGPQDSHLRRPTYDGARLTTGLVFNFGGTPELPVAASCSVQNAEVMVGEPVHVTVAASNFNPKHTLTYDWKSSGGKIEGKDTSATIDTNGVSGGSYTATATVTDAKSKKNGTASCTSNFTVKEPPKNPPQFSCSVSPTTVQPGTSATVTCTCTSPDNVPVTVSGWTASGGSISGSGNSATLNTTGASPGTISINATCTDSRGLTASSPTSVTVENPPPPPPQATKLNECTYPNAKKPWRVDNTCKAALDDVALRLQQDPEAKLVVVGNAEPTEKRKDLAAERAADVKFYVSSGEAKQNIDPSRIEVRTGTEGTGVTEHWIVPSGATFPEASSTTPVDETKVKPIPDHPKPVAKKKAAKKAQ
jgi:outer membrane protein OmpA-like peptidoglycan-associated protein